jgi:hypothetical protein
MEHESVGSQYPVAQYDDDPRLLALEQAFYDVWKVICAHEPDRDFAEDHERRVELSRALTVLAATGVTDADELRRLFLERLPLPRSN